MRKFLSNLLPRTILVIVILTLVSISLPVAVSAEQGTLGTEEPYLYCFFENESGDIVDGNSLSSGTYTVDVKLSGMKSVSIFEFTAEVNPAVVTELSVSSTNSDFVCGGADYNANGDNRLAVALVSEDENCTDVNTDDGALVMATLSVDISAPEESTVDFQDYFTFVTDPDLTFAESDYRDGYNDAYVLDTSVQKQYNTYLMTADESPENELEPDTITVSGKILIASDAQGTASAFGLRGVKVYAYDDNNQVIAETVSNADGDVSTWGDYELEVPAGTTNFMVGDYVADTIVNRSFTIAGDADVTDANIAVVMCDYNDDGGITVIDKASFNSALRGAYNIYADFNNDGGITVIDKGTFNSILKTGTVEYTPLTID